MSWFDGKKIVAPIDFCEESKWGIDTALEIAGTPENVQLIHVAVAVDELPPAVSWDPGDEKKLRNEVVDHFRKEFAGAPYTNLSFEVRFGDPGQQITRYAKEIGAVPQAASPPPERPIEFATRSET